MVTPMGMVDMDLLDIIQPILLNIIRLETPFTTTDASPLKRKIMHKCGVIFVM